MNNIKTHFQENKKFYFGVGTGLVIAGITFPIMRGCHVILLRGMNGLKPADASVTMRTLSFFSQQSNEVVTVIHNGARGNPGFMTRNLDYDIVFPTQAAAARAFNISPANLSSHLNGKFDDVSGYHFERIGMSI